MTQKSNYKSYFELEDRCLKFAQRSQDYVRKLPKDLPNQENGKQLTRSAGSVGANYIETNESLSKKDFLMRIKISKKEAKESRYWLILTNPLSNQEAEKEALIDESVELMKILGSIAEKCK